MQNTFDVIIIGSGIVGSLTARYLSRYDIKILVVEKEADIGMNPSSANSAIIHSGYDPKPGTVKALMNSSGNKIWHTLSHELGVSFKNSGSYVVAIGNEELPRLRELYGQGVANSVPGLQILGREEFLSREPLINPEVSGALWAPSAAVIDPFGAVLAAAENAASNGVVYLFETEFIDFISDKGRITGVRTNRGDFFCKWAVNSAGLHSGEVANRAGTMKDFVITPRKGSYLIFDPMKLSINNVLFPVPSEKGKGILVSTTTHGNVMIGPNNEPCEGMDDSATTATGLAEVINGAKKLVPSVDPRNVIAEYAGIRASGNAGRDFVIEIAKGINGLINLCGIESPGFASAPAIALKVVDLLQEAGAVLKEKLNWDPVRNPAPHFHSLSLKDRAELVKKNPAYGRIVCRCEEITEGEIIDAIRSIVPARTYDGIKRRTWLGTGRCQGAFDYPRVIQIMAREFGVPETEVTKKGKGSELVFRNTKDVVPS
jgi:glycerol-3-phosphate dehydrogenase